MNNTNSSPNLAKQPSKDPLHGITLKAIVEHLYEYYGWDRLSQKINLKCFSMNPSVKSSLTFLRKTDWARKKVESLYLYTLREARRNNKKYPA
jgi:uncharacterized protein (DUF2132 family)